MLKRAFIIILIFMFSSAAFADEIKLHKKGTRVVFTEDMHCMTNATSLRIISKVKLCDESHKIEIEGLKKTYTLEIEALKKKLELKDETYSSIIEKKDKTTFDIQQVTLKELSSYRDNTWITVTISVAVGLAVGSGIAIAASSYAN